MRWLLALLLWAAPAFAHEWYPAVCCSDRDCFMVPAGAVSPVEGGYFIHESGETIPYEMTQPSPDGQYHRCVFLSGDRKGMTRKYANKGYCLFVPLGV